ncbi:Clp protease N-terminal domain-containing protein [Streptomyces sp. NBC_01498]|uniref:Clp protease N-terminal domain-containing protein n=1 Tax=Streptomyces sp. NBC_01498 TaxID=2975870 RepID=UPI003FCE20C9
MQTSTPWLPGQSDPAVVSAVSIRADIDAGLSAGLAAVVSGARRRAHRDGDRQTDTAHLLHSLLESDSEVRAAFDGGPQLARVLGYLVQRSIGYGLRWQGTVERSAAAPAARTPEVSGWSPSAVAVLEAAVERARRRGEPRAGGPDLLTALVSDPDCRAVEVLARAGVDARMFVGRAVDPPSGR